MKIEKEELQKIVQKVIQVVFRNKLYVIGIAVAVICIIITMWQMTEYYVERKESEDKVEVLRKEVLREELILEEEEDLKVSKAPEKTPEKAQNPYADIFAQNKDMAAWLTVADTKIDYPVMQTMENETYYIDKDFYGNPDKAGCLLLDTDSSLTNSGTTNQIIHGHNMKAGTMFGELEKYKKADYGTSHNKMVLYTLEDKREYEVISAFYSQVFYQTDTCFKYYKFFEAQTEEEFKYFYDNIKEMSLYDTGVTAELGDSFITLSTCSYQVEDGRFVVIAKEVNREIYE